MLLALEVSHSCGQRVPNGCAYVGCKAVCLKQHGERAIKATAGGRLVLSVPLAADLGVHRFVFFRYSQISWHSYSHGKFVHFITFVGVEAQQNKL